MTAKKAVSAKDMGTLKISNMGDGTAATDAATKQQVDAAAAFGASLANRGTTTTDHTAINDWDLALQQKRLDQFSAPTAPVAFGSQRITTLADPTAAQDGATKNYVDTVVSGLASGLDLKGSVRVAASTNVTIATPGTTIDGVALNTGDLVLLTGQTTASQNGPYVFNGSALAMTRATNWNTNAQAVLGSFWIVQMGSNADSFAILTNDTAIVLGTTALTFAFVKVGANTGFTLTSPAVSAGTAWAIVHNFATRGVVWQCYRTASPFDDVEVYGERTDINTLTLKPDIAMASGEYTVVISRVI